VCTVSSGRAYLAWSARARFSELAEPAVGRGGAPRLTRDQLTAQLFHCLLPRSLSSVIPTFRLHIQTHARGGFYSNDECRLI